ncbi:hypothetical protein BD560DRAFT_97061 [Blakeslea trispora]|nr:hypothetical protein BD560DRAFT_97061 [Blakeslea trispora]
MFKYLYKKKSINIISFFFFTLFTMNPGAVAYPPDNLNELAPPERVTGTAETERQKELENAPKIDSNKHHSILHDMKENIKETFQSDHHHGQEGQKRPQDGKTNPME